MVFTTEIIQRLLDMKATNSIRRIAIIVLGFLLFVQVHAQHATTFKFSDTAPEQVRGVMENNANALFAEINQKYDQDNSQLDIKGCATEFAQNRISNMWAVSHFYCTRTIMNVRVLKMVGVEAYQVRNIPVCFKETENDEYKYQSLVMEFDNQGKISDLYISISEYGYSRDITNLVDYKYKELIIRFLDNYLTAYNCKDLDFIEKMFVEDVLMITGKVVNYKTNESTNNNKSKIENVVQNKQQYLEKLRGIFQRNSFVNIKIDGIEITQSEANPRVYGIGLNEYWHVSNNSNTGGYHDEGRLFFIIDFTNENQPEIVVAAWQPFKDANGNPIEYSEDDFFHLGDFPIE